MFAMIKRLIHHSNQVNPLKSTHEHKSQFKRKSVFSLTDDHFSSIETLRKTSKITDAKFLAQIPVMPCHNNTLYLYYIVVFCTPDNLSNKFYSLIGEPIITDPEDTVSARNAIYVSLHPDGIPQEVHMFVLDETASDLVVGKHITNVYRKKYVIEKHIELKFGVSSMSHQLDFKLLHRCTTYPMLSLMQ